MIATTREVPFLRTLYQRNPDAYAFGFVGLILAIWGVRLIWRRNDTPEFTTEVIAFIAALGGLAYFFVKAFG